MNGEAEHLFTVEIYERDKKDEDVHIDGWIVQADNRWEAFRTAKLRAGNMVAGPRLKQDVHVSTAEEIKDSDLVKEHMSSYAFAERKTPFPFLFGC